MSFLNFDTVLKNNVQILEIKSIMLPLQLANSSPQHL